MSVATSTAPLYPARPTLRLVAVFFIALSCAVAWIPLAVSIAGLHLRASQVVLPLVLMLLWVQRPFTNPSRQERRIAACGALWWAATLWWTLVGGSAALKPLGRVFLHGLHLLQFLAVYLLILRSRRLDDALRSFLVAVAVLNAFVLVVSSLASLGVTIPEAFLAEEDAPLAVGGEVVVGSVRRFSVGVAVGCVSAGAFVLALSLLLDPAERRKGRLLLCAAFAVVGFFVGFSRQGVLSLLAGLTVVMLGSLEWRHLLRLMRAAILTVVVVLVVVGLLWITPGGQDYLQAFTGRTLLLVQPDGYTTGTVIGRTSMWLDMLADIRANPFVGRGQDAYLQYMVNVWEEGSHNFPLEVLHAAGLWGFVPYAILHATLAFAAVGLIRRARRFGQPPFALLGLLGAYVALALASTTNLIFWNPVYWLVAAMLAAATSLTGDAVTAGRIQLPLDASETS